MKIKNLKLKKLHKKASSLLSVLAILIITSLIFVRLTAKADSLIGFNEGSGTTVHDSEGDASGAITGAVWKPESDCLSENCLYFDGTGDYVSFGDDSNFDFAETANFTIEFWFKTPTITSGTRVMVSKYRGDDTEGGYKIYMDTSGAIIFTVDDDNTFDRDDMVISTQAYDDNHWHHITATKTGTTNLTLYIDALRVSQDVSISATGTLVNDDPLVVGMDSDLTSNPFTGFIDELKIFTTTSRSEDQVKTDYQKASTTTGTAARFGTDPSGLSSGLLGYWDLNHSSGNASDTSGLKHPAINYNAATYTAGKYGQGSEHVPASSQYLGMGYRAIDDIRAVSFWVNPDSTTNYFLDINSTTNIQSSSGTITANGFTNPQIYVNGTPTTTISADTWQQVTVTSDTAVDTGVDYDYDNSISYRSMSCPSIDDCKIAFYDSTAGDLKFLDCENIDCSAYTITTLDGASSGNALTGAGDRDTGQYTSLDCSAGATDCKISYYDVTNGDLYFADCDTATCSSGTATKLDGSSSGNALTGAGDRDTGQYISLDCSVGATDCKISYYSTTGADLYFADCDTVTCSTGTATLLDGGVSGNALTGAADKATGQYTSLDCSAGATDCKISYFDVSNDDLYFADCDTATCSSGTATLIDSTAQVGSTTSLDCSAGSTDCKISYYNISATNLYFADCDTATCSSKTLTLLDGADSGNALTGAGSKITGLYSSLDCSNGATDCKISYYDVTNNDLYFADCDTATCSTGTTTVVASKAATGRSSLECTLGATDCKIASPSDTSDLSFIDCDNSTCSSPTSTWLAGANYPVNGTYSDTFCVTVDDCKIAFYDSAAGDLKFLDCENIDCSAYTITTLDGASSGNALTGAGDRDTGQYVSLDCSAGSADCKISYLDSTNYNLYFADCDTATCSTGTATLLDGGVSGNALTGAANKITGYYTSLDCSAGAIDCKISYYDTTNDDLYFADCDTATCSTGTATLLDGGVSGNALTGAADKSTGMYSSLDCSNGATDCKISYFSTTGLNLYFADCDTAACSTGTATLLDGGISGNALTGAADKSTGQYTSLDCSAGTADCKISYYDMTSGNLYFADCDTATCSTGTATLLDGGISGNALAGAANKNTGYHTSLDCSAGAIDCKISYHDSTNLNLYFADCGTATCSTGTATLLDGGVSGNALTGAADKSTGTYTSLDCSTGATDCKTSYYDSTNSDLYFADCDTATCSSGSTDNFNPILSGGLTDPNGGFHIGRIGSNYFDGTMDEVRLYNRTLSSSEIESLYTWAPGPVGYWKLDENTGTSTTADVSGNGYTGTLTSITSESWVPGKFGSALDLDGTADFVDVGTGPTAVNTVSFWVKPDTTSEYFLDLNGSAYISASSGTVSATGFTGPVYYVNGVQTASPTVTANTWYHITVTTTTSLDATDLDIGRLEGTDYLAGVIDDVKIYNYVRSPAQIIEDMNAGHPAPGSPVGSALLHYRFDEGYGDTAYDTGSGANNGDLGGSGHTCPGATTTACPSWTNSGKFGKALDFDPGGTVDDRVDSALTTSLSEKTISVWINADTISGDGRILFKNSEMALFIDSTGSIRYVHLFSVSGGGWGTAAGTITTGSWYHIAVTYDYSSSSNVPRIFLNGQEKTVSTLAPASGTANSNTNAYFIGNSTILDLPFDGKIDELKIYNFALTADQIKAEYNQGVAQTMGSLGTNSTGANTFDATNSYCPPGQGSACTGPVAEWNFDDSSTSTVNDSSGNNKLATAHSFGTEAYRTNGKFGKAFSFSGSGTANNVGIYTNSTFTPPTQVTVEAWVYPKGTGGSNVGRIFSGSESSAVSGYFLTAENTNCYRFRANWTTDGQWYTPLGTLTLNQWTHIAITYDASSDTNNPDIYLNGILQVQDNTCASNVSASGTWTNTADNWAIGGGDSSIINNFNGLIDQVRVYDYIRTPTQVVWDYNQGAPVAQYNFNDCSGSSLHDTAPKADRNSTKYDGTIYPQALDQTAVGTCTSSANTMWYNGRTGKFNNSLNFDDSDDYVSVTDTLALDLTSGLTVSAWVKTDANEADNVIVSKGTSYEMGINADGDVYWDGVGAQVDDASTKVLTGTWHHVVVTNDDTTATYYVDGIKTGTSAAGVDADVATDLYIGYDGTNFFDGVIDDVRIYNYVLTPTQIKTLYNNNSAVKF